jgi:hypothetical protein
MQPLPVRQSTPHCYARALFGACCLASALSACGGGGGGGDEIKPRPDAGGAQNSDAGPAIDVDGDGKPDVRSNVIDAPNDVRRALCSNEYETAVLDYDQLTRGSWQFNPGGSFVELPEPGYPCQAFRHDAMRPTPFDEGWTDAQDRDFVGFSEVSTISAAGYMTAQFRYFRTLIFVPSGTAPPTLTVEASGIDDALYLAIYNSANPEGLSPEDVGPSEAGVGACHGNGRASWDLARYLEPGEINMLLLVHADMSPATSALSSVQILAGGLPLQMVNCDGS